MLKNNQSYAEMIAFSKVIMGEQNIVLKENYAENIPNMVFARRRGKKFQYV